MEQTLLLLVGDLLCFDCPLIRRREQICEAAAALWRRRALMHQPLLRRTLFLVWRSA
jgi:hypothetical protein